MKIKALSLWQPWASLIAVRAKEYETRSWKTNYTGPLLICASRKMVQIHDSVFLGVAKSYLPNFYNLPLGQAVAVSYLRACFETRLLQWPYDWYVNRPERIEQEKLFGDFSPGRFAWWLENARTIDPFPVTGRQGLFDVEVPSDLLVTPQAEHHSQKTFDFFS